MMIKEPKQSVIRRFSLILLVLAIGFIACPGAAQERTDTQTSVPQLVPKVFIKDDSTEPGKEVKPATSPFPGLAEVVPRAADLGQKAIKAEEAIAATRDTSTFDRRIAETENQIGQITKKIAGMGDPASWNIYRLLDVQHLIQAEKNNLAAILNPISSRLSELEAARKTWEEEHIVWKKWEESLTEVQTEIPLEKTFKKAQETAAAVVQSASNASAPLLALQQKLTKQRDELLQLSIPVETALMKVRSETFQKNTPSFFSREFFEQFDPWLWVASKGGIIDVWTMDREYLPLYAWMVSLQVLAILTITYLIRRRRRFPEKTSEWRFIREHPLAFSIFVTQGITAPFYQASAPPWLFLTLALVISSASFLVSDMLAYPRMRRVLFVLAGVQIISAILKLISLPAPLFSLYLALILMSGVWFFLHQARRHLAEQGGRWDLFSVGLRAGALFGSAALLVLLAGYSNLADYLTRSFVWTVFLIIIAFLLLHLGNGGIEILLHQPAVARLGFFSRFGDAFESRLKNLLKAILWFAVFLALFQLWGIYTSFGQAWENIFEFKFAIGELTLSLGRILLSALFLYLILSGSWFVRAFLDGEVFPRRQLDLGARDAIKKMIHYSLLFVGIMMAISVLGLNLTGFAFLTGALGIGVGFGLQNIVNNFVSGLMLLFERPFKVGDMVVIDNETGTVRKIGLRSTVIETFDRSELIVPNSQFISGKVTNWTRSNHVARVRIAVGVAYGSDVKLVLQLLTEAAASDHRVLRNPAPNPLFLRFGDSSLEFELHAWLSDVNDLLSVRSSICQEIARCFQEAGVEIPFPQRDLHVRSVDAKILELALGLKKEND
jgi:potassium-dependent mechanosensitive channel